MCHFRKDWVSNFEGIGGNAVLPGLFFSKHDRKSKWAMVRDNFKMCCYLFIIGETNIFIFW